GRSNVPRSCEPRSAPAGVNGSSNGGAGRSRPPRRSSSIRRCWQRPGGTWLLPVRYDQLGVQPGDRVLDLGCGFGRHAYESMRRGAPVGACASALAKLTHVSRMCAAISDEESAALRATAWGACVNGDGTRLPFADGTF